MRIKVYIRGVGVAYGLSTTPTKAHALLLRMLELCIGIMVVRTQVVYWIVDRVDKCS